ncbi:hypothetical protein EET67_00745 [Pseudaminobacter arsenicus]|uniref:Uncharacterized protein n=1 Tax=Borborobacter arsenicus TaxID=1851146 RepID=A0A432VBC1_9HYPH|nr:hypothetical protein [Pseudaminobacter arsenicus]RUM99471.1 hypothetical protein EET67_00745 [Pseudaminobacter arsenicus]
MNAKSSDIIRLAATTSLRISTLPTAKEQTAALKRHIEVCDVFLGVVLEGDGEHRILVKGRAILEDIVASGRPRRLIQGAISVSCAEEAIAMRHVFGDGEGMAKAPGLERAG